MFFKPKIYNALKWLALVIMPVVIFFYSGLGEIWNFPENNRVGATLALVNAALGLLLQRSSSNYQNSDKAIGGYLTQNGEDPDTGIPNLQLTVTKDPKTILDGKTTTLKIGPPPPRIPVPAGPDTQPATPPLGE